MQTRIGLAVRRRADRRRRPHFAATSPRPRRPLRGAGQPARRRSTIRSSSRVTVYNSDIALVRDVREPAAAARQLRPALHGHRRDGESGDRAFPIADRAVARDVLEQNYEYDLLEPDKLLRKYVGRDVTLVRRAIGERRDAARKR